VSAFSNWSSHGHFNRSLTEWLGIAVYPYTHFGPEPSTQHRNPQPNNPQPNTPTSGFRLRVEGTLTLVRNPQPNTADPQPSTESLN
jgi:hypothetical protein